MFIIEENAARYISRKSDSIVIELTLEPSLGGCPCAGMKVAGCLMPKVEIGAPDEKEGFDMTDVEGIHVYYDRRLQVKEGYTHITVKCRRFILFSILELDGAQPIVVQGS